MKKTLFCLLAIVLPAIALVSCDKDDDSPSGSKNTTWTIATTNVNVNDATDAAQTAFRAYVTSLESTLSSFTLPSSTEQSKIDAKAQEIIENAGIEAKLKAKAQELNVGSYTVGFKLKEDWHTLSLLYSYYAHTDADDVEQTWTIAVASPQVNGYFDRSTLDELNALYDKYKSSLTCTYTGKKDGAYQAMKNYLEGDDCKALRDDIDAFTTKYDNAGTWYWQFVMQGKNRLWTDKYQFGSWDGE